MILNLLITRLSVDLTCLSNCLFFPPFLISLNLGTDERYQKSLCNSDRAEYTEHTPGLKLKQTSGCFFEYQMMQLYHVVRHYLITTLHTCLRLA